ncbi:hypothetical protein K491DRAFT_679491 [Lophiostoma macrostomum CBS 122681]|uniref:FHA domain-containing protein n=1 Tax=Lophiostoma macrostomum CBS 122681 TaxID=1314788 RepID=A0A6A6T5W2_9PLEO|nr:hypothetical protein K491DRAFT_679491 [Lophiostoma macrostomum CBS 122681]
MSKSHTRPLQSPDTMPRLTYTRTGPLEVTLRSADGLDKIPQRRVTLEANSPVTIGRSSRNPAKGLMACHKNLYIDSPVVSRQHAVLELKNTPAGGTAVFITDKHSTHGTMVNNKALDPGHEHELRNGDHLQIGNDVARDKGKKSYFPTSAPSPHSRAQADDYFAVPEFFTAKKYRYNSNLVAPFFPKGFAVPDPVSSDGEDVDDDDDKEISRSLGQPPRYGSQTNPVNVDDFGEDTVEILVGHKINAIAADTDSLAESLQAARDEKYNYTSPVYQPQSPHLFSPLGEDNDAGFEAEFDAETESQQDSASDESSEADLDVDDEENGSDVDSMDISDADSSSDSPSSCPDENAQNDDVDVLRRHKLNAMLFHQERKGTEEAIQPERRMPAAPPTIETPASLPAAAAAATVPESSQYSFREPLRYGSPQYPGASTPSAWNRSGEPAAPARPSAPKAWPTLSSPSVQFGYSYDPPLDMYPVMPEYPTDYAFARNLNTPALSTPAEPVFARTKAYPPLQFAEFTMENDELSNGPPTNGTTAATGVPTPPMPSSPVMSAAPATPQQPQRTKVSIAEIVEDAPQAQQAPTPASIASPPSPPTLKRKRDAMESEETVVERAEEQTVLAAPVPVPEAVVVAPVREKKRKTNNGGRTWLKAAFQTTATLATGALIGGAATVYTLLNAPSSWGLEDM